MQIRILTENKLFYQYLIKHFWNISKLNFWEINQMLKRIKNHFKLDNDKNKVWKTLKDKNGIQKFYPIKKS